MDNMKRVRVFVLVFLVFALSACASSTEPEPNRAGIPAKAAGKIEEAVGVKKGNEPNLEIRMKTAFELAQAKKLTTVVVRCSEEQARKCYEIGFSLIKDYPELRFASVTCENKYRAPRGALVLNIDCAAQPQEHDSCKDCWHTRLRLSENSL